MPAHSILIADDHPLIVAGLSAVINSYPEFRLVGQAANGLQAIQMYETLQPDVLITDLAMPGMNGVQVIEHLRRNDPAARIIILTTYSGDEDIYRGMHAGAMAYLMKDCDFGQLRACINAVAQGRKFLPPEVAGRLAARMESNCLSKRELEILAHLATGKSNKMIARSADIEVGTVKFHVNNILTKLNVASRTEAATVAARRGLLSVF